MKTKVNFKFKNKKGEDKEVVFYMDKISYEMICDPSIDEETRYWYLFDEYHEHERERNFKRKHPLLDIETLDIIDPVYDEHDYDRELIERCIAKLTPRQRKMLKMKFKDGKKQKEIAKELNISKQSVSDAMHRIYKTLKKYLTEEGDCEHLGL